MIVAPEKKLLLSIIIFAFLLQETSNSVVSDSISVQPSSDIQKVLGSYDDDKSIDPPQITFYTIQKVDGNLYYSQISSNFGQRPDRISDITKVSMSKSSKNLIDLNQQQQQAKNNSDDYQIFTQNVQIKQKDKESILADDKKQVQVKKQNQNNLNTSNQSKRPTVNNLTNPQVVATSNETQKLPASTAVKKNSTNTNNNLTQGQSSQVLAYPYIRFGSLFSLSSISLGVRLKKKTIINRQFSNVGLYHQIPTIFVSEQVYRFYGIVTNQQTIKTQPFLRYDRVNVVFIDTRRNKQFKCSEQNPKSLQFDISCKMQTPGRYFMSIFVGNSGRSSPLQRQIVQYKNLNSPYYMQDPQPKGLRVQVVNNSLFVVWDSKANLTNLTIYQQYNGTINKRQYLLSNNHEKYKVQFKDFNDFLPTTTFIQISHAKSLDGTLNVIYTKFGKKKAKIQFQALDHAFNIKSENITMLPELPWRLQVGQKFIFNIKSKQAIRSVVYITQPDMKLRKLLFILTDDEQLLEINRSTTIPPETQITLQITFTKPGTHIIQINNVGGLALINRPVYVGSGYPLIPDYKDLLPTTFSARSNISFERILQDYYSRTTQKLKIQQPPRNSSQNQKINYLLTLLNGLRAKYNVRPLQIDDTLYRIAKNHSDDMVKRNFFGHSNPQGQKAKERARKFNFTNLVGQNLAQTTYLTENHLGLQRSAIHLEAMIGRTWTRVGIGINIAKNGQYVVTYLFSTRDLKKIPLTDEQIINYQQDLIAYIQRRNPNILKQNKQISKLIKTWMSSNRETSLLPYIYNIKGRINIIGIGLSVGFSEDWVDRLESSDVLNGYLIYEEVSVGSGLKNTGGGTLQIFVIFS